LTETALTPPRHVYDLHSHTTASDGLFTPTMLVQRAVEKGVTVLAITDHDTTAGLAEAHQAIKEFNLPLRLINGVEISTAWQNFDIHVVGLNIDPANDTLSRLLSQQKQQRQIRAEEIARRLEKAGIAGALDGAKQIAAGADLTRAHFARYIMQTGKVNSLSKVFSKYLGKGKTGYVAPQWCSIPEAITAIQAAGGLAVLAHPTRYDLSGKWLRRLIADFKQSNGDGIEVALSQQTPDQRTQIAQHAREHQLLASQGSDFHQPCAWLDLGRNLWLPEQLEPVWLRW
jgi:predicted metal-dependent phosphoesterase TrpH